MICSKTFTSEKAHSPLADGSTGPVFNEFSQPLSNKDQSHILLFLLAHQPPLKQSIKYLLQQVMHSFCYAISIILPFSAESHLLFPFGRQHAGRCTRRARQLHQICGNYSTQYKMYIRESPTRSVTCCPPKTQSWCSILDTLSLLNTFQSQSHVTVVKPRYDQGIFHVLQKWHQRKSTTWKDCVLREQNIFMKDL